MKATIYDIAREAGVSIATVSNAINGKGNISQKRRKEIVEIMERMHYQPSVIASALMGKRTFTIGLLIPDVSNPFFSEIARAIEDQAHQAGYSVIICSTDNKDERIERYIKLLEQKSVDGIIIGTGIDNLDILKQLLSKSIPVAMIAREVDSLSLHTVITDDFYGGRIAAEHLIELGHRKLAVLAENLKVSSSRERVRGFKSALIEAGIPFDDSNVVVCDYKIEDGKRGARVLLRKEDRPTAIFCCNDMLAIGVLQAAKDEGLQVPADLSIIGFDNTILSNVVSPPITTIAQPMEYMVKLVFELLVSNLEKDLASKKRIVLRPELIIRQSTASVNKDY